MKILPADSAWLLPVTDWPEHPDSAKIVSSVGKEKPLRYNPDMAFVIVPPDQKKIPVEIVDYANESDSGPYPVPENLPIEGWPAYFQREPKHAELTLEDVQLDRANLGGDRHAIVLDPANGFLWEFYAMKKTAHGWKAAQASFFDLKSNKSRPVGWTSSDAAGLPLFVSSYNSLR